MRPSLKLYLVGDGVGGNQAGDVASSLAAHSMNNFFAATRNDGWPDEYRALLDLTLAPPAQRLSAAIRKANKDVYEIASTRRGSRMNTTVVALHISDGPPPSSRGGDAGPPVATPHVHIAHVGDSRCYQLRDGELRVLTRDHSLRNEARISSPSLSERQIERIPERVITRALGVKQHVEIEHMSFPVEPGDAFLLCSDGVNRMLSDDEILEGLEVADSPAEAAELLVDLANEAGGRDNITALVVQFAGG